MRGGGGGGDTHSIYFDKLTGVIVFKYIEEMFRM